MLNEVKLVVKKAKALWRKVISYDPTLTDPYYTLLNLSLENRDFDETTHLLVGFLADAGMKYDDLTQQEEFEEYIKSEAYQDWLEYSKGRE